MCQPSCNIFFHFLKCRNSKVLPILLIIITDDFNKPIFLELNSTIVINAGIEQCCDFKPGIHFLNQAIIVDSFRYTACCKYSVKLTIVAQSSPVLQNIFYYRYSMLCSCILSIRYIILNTFNVVSCAVNISGHSHFTCIHIFIIYFALCRIVNSFFLGQCLCFFQSNSFTNIFVLKSQHFVWVKPKNILISDSVSNAVSM